MLEVVGFRGLTYDTDRIVCQDYVITPPYDVISPEDRARLTANSHYSMAHLLLPEGSEGRSPYEVASNLLDAWIAGGVLTQDEEPCFYLLRQSFQDLAGVDRVRRAIFAAVSIPEPGERHILGHERTFEKPFEDRLRLTEATRANLGAVFGLYSDPENVLAPLLAQMETRTSDAGAVTIDGVRQEFWRVPHDEAVTDFMRGKTLYIADGHHRFLTACAYREAMHKAHPNARGPRPYDFLLMGLVAFEDPGLAIYPPHRLVRKPDGFDSARFLEDLAHWFEVTPVEKDLKSTVERAGKAAPSGACVFGVAIHGAGEYLLELRGIPRAQLLGEDRAPAWRGLDVAVLHRGVIEHILRVPEGTEFVYEKSAKRAVEAARNGDTGLAFILRPTRAEQIRACAEAGEPMPQKSTYFFPKIPSGVVIHRLIDA